MKKTVYHSKSIRNRILLFTLSSHFGNVSVDQPVQLLHIPALSAEHPDPVHGDQPGACCRSLWTTVWMKSTGWSDIARQIPILPIILNITPIPALSCPYPLMIPSTRNAAGILLIIICPELPVSQEHYLQVVTATYSSTADLATLIPELPYYEEITDCR